MNEASAKKLSVLIPVYNEADTVAEVLDRVRQADLSSLGLGVQAVIVDDGGADGGGEIMRRFLADHPDFDAKLIVLPTNCGKGCAIQHALAAADGEFVIVQDADLEYHPRDWPVLLAPLVRGEADVVFGSRIMPLGADQKRRRVYRIGLTIGKAVVFVLWPGAYYTDMATCYKAFRTDLLRALRLERQHFDFDAEVAVKLLNRRIPIVERPISYRPRFKEHGKKIRWGDFFEGMWVVFRYRFYDPTLRLFDYRRGGS
jgi:glycosyltransferase involved in cell wall biosynthesis